MASAAGAWIAVQGASIRPAHALEPLLDGPGKAWKDGPASCIITKEELKSFKSLKTDQERTQAIAQFWSRRDPTPGTPRNEFKEHFARRVGHVLRHLSNETNGWTTDEGRILLVVGYNDGSRSVPGGSIDTFVRDFPPEAGKWGGQTVAVEVGFSKDDTGVERMSPQGHQLLDIVRKMDPLEAALFSMQTHQGH